MDDFVRSFPVISFDLPSSPPCPSCKLLQHSIGEAVVQNWLQTGVQLAWVTDGRTHVWGHHTQTAKMWEQHVLQKIKTTCAYTNEEYQWIKSKQKWSGRSRYKYNAVGLDDMSQRILGLSLENERAKFLKSLVASEIFPRSWDVWSKINALQRENEQVKGKPKQWPMSPV